MMWSIWSFKKYSGDAVLTPTIFPWSKKDSSPTARHVVEGVDGLTSFGSTFVRGRDGIVEFGVHPAMIPALVIPVAIATRHFFIILL
jgi:hypothetical protein